MKYLLLGFLLFNLSLTQAQPVTTFILVRHAEKGDDGTKDPDLTETGMSRAESLATLLRETKVDAIYSTAYKRTNNTVAPLSRAKSLPVQGYEAFKGEEIDKMLKQHTGGTITVVGHSNNIPWIANYLTGKETYPSFEDSDYDNVFIVTVFEKGKTAKVVRLSY
jgi:2,3-bisphosphoglycerate-dependent phosphoglycerate mutase